jgi:hypothetical protein
VPVPGLIEMGIQSIKYRRAAYPELDFAYAEKDGLPK